MPPRAGNTLQRKDRLERFRGVRARLDPSGDPMAAMASSYVAIPRSVSSRITAELALSPTSSHLLIGGVGSGKTTELLAVQNQLPEIDDDIRGIYLDVSKQHDIARMVPGAIAVQVGLALAGALGGDPALEFASKQLDELAHGYWSDYEWDQDGDDYRVPGILISPEQVEDNVQRALVPLEHLVAAIHKTHSYLVILLDGLDRMTDMPAFDQLVTHDVKAMIGIGIGVVLVGPLRALYGLDRTIAQRFDSLHYQPWIDVTQSPEGHAFLVDVLRRRVPGDVFAAAGVETLVAASGGVMRDLLSLAQSACVEAYIDGADQVGSLEVAAAIDAFGRKHLQGLRPAELEILQRVRATGSFLHTSEDDLALLMTRRVLEYRGQGPVRYAVHPAIEKLLAGLGAR
jgi:Cdc6-like AAA superfamily ATPase